MTPVPAIVRWQRTGLPGKLGVTQQHGEIQMNSTQIVGIALIVAGLLGLAYGGFSYTKTTDQAQLGPITLSVTDKQSVSVPVWAGVGTIFVGAVLLAAGRRRG
jgi:hypothetical protein